MVHAEKPCELGVSRFRRDNCIFKYINSAQKSKPSGKIHKFASWIEKIANFVGQFWTVDIWIYLPYWAQMIDYEYKLRGFFHNMPKWTKIGPFHQIWRKMRHFFRLWPRRKYAFWNARLVKTTYVSQLPTVIIIMFYAFCPFKTTLYMCIHSI